MMSQFQEVEEEHKHRLNQANEFFEYCLSEVAGFDEWAMIKDKILLYLQDYWSVIRVKTFKFLQNSAPKFSTSQLQSLLEEFKACFVFSDQKEKPAWQQIHGSFLGYIAVLPMLDGVHLNYLSGLCFGFIGQVSNPIRECCKDALVQISKRNQSLVISKILEEIQKIVTQNPSADDKNGNNLKYPHDEQETLRLDGLLSCLVEIVPFMSISSFTLSSSTSKTADSIFSFSSMHNENSSVLPLELFVSILKHCMLHNASTVRQKAGNITSKLFRMFLTKTECSNDFVYRCLAFVIANLIIQVLSLHALEYWNGHEAALIISEEIIRDFYMTYMDTVAGKSSGICTDSSVLIELSRLLSFLEDELIILLCHPRFEVRRVIIQSLPVFARGKIVIEGAISLLEKNGAKEASVEKQYKESLDEKKIKRESLDKHFLSAVEAVWISTLIKENRQLREVISSHVISSPGIGENWGAEFHGRFLELELRSEFRNKLVSIAEFREGTVFISSALQVSDIFILELLESHFAIDSEETEESSSDVSSNHYHNSWLSSNKYISLDFIEFHILTESFLQNIINKSSDTFQNVDDSFPVLITKDADMALGRLHGHALSWASMLVYFQFISNSETIPSIRYESAYSMQTAEIALNILEKDAWSLSEKLPVLEYWKAGNEMTAIRLLPTLTDPATNPIIYADEAVLSQSFDEGTAIEEQLSVTVSNAHNIQPTVSTTCASRPASHPTSPTKTRSMNGSFSFSLGSPKASVPQMTPNNLGVGSNLPIASNINSYQGMNRWNCEAISPLLYQFSTFNGNRTVSSLLSTVVIEWMVYSFQDASWLENRRFAKRMLFESFPNLIGTALNDTSSDLKTEYSLLLVSILKRLAEFWQCVNQTNEKNPSSKLSDLKLVLPVLKATTAIVKYIAVLSVSQLQQANSRSQFTASPIGDFFSTLISSLKKEIATLKEIYKLNETKETTANQKKNEEPKINVVELHSGEQTQDEEAQEQEDEFSDWDDEDDSAIITENEMNQNAETIYDSFDVDLAQLEQEIEKWSSRLL
jgi:hypothetical protein